MNVIQTKRVCNRSAILKVADAMAAKMHPCGQRLGSTLGRIVDIWWFV